MEHKRTPAQISADAKRTGRPRKAKAEKLGKRVPVSFTAAELRTVKAEARKAGLPLASFLKARLWRKES